MSVLMTAPWVLAVALCLMAHLLADFPLQSDRVAALKKESNRALAVHGVWALGLFTLVMAPFIGPIGALLFALVQASSHVLIDRAKIILIERASPVGPKDWSARPAALMLIDQVLHLAVLAASFRLLGAIDPSWSGDAATLGRVVETMIGLPAGNGISALLLVAIGGILLLVNAWLGRYIIDALVNPSGANESARGPAHGAAIGVTERLLIVGLVLVGHWEGIAVVLGVKALARFPDFGRSGDGGRQFAEQFILGTLASLALALASAVLIRWVVLGYI